MVLRSAAGVTTACTALTLCVGVALHAMPPGGSKTNKAPWGILSTAPFAPPGDASQLPHRPDVDAQPAATTAQQAAAATPPVTAASAVLVNPPTLRPPLVEVISTSPAPPSPEPEPAPANQAVVPTPPANMRVMAEPAETPSDDARINLNKASVDDLNHLPGNSHIGRAIVHHRPYRSIDELVAKRVLRESDFERVKAKIKVE
jgi:DNA uptake protein ComE-like DNA-binding protein